MKQTLWTIAVIVFLAAVLVGCDGLFQLPATPTEQVEGFLDAASAEPQDPYALRAYFDSSAADYDNMYDSTYWALHFFDPIDRPFGILGASEDTSVSGTATVTGYLTSANNTDPGYPAEFVLTTYPDDPFADPLIRKITITVDTTTFILEKVLN